METGQLRLGIRRMATKLEDHVADKIFNGRVDVGPRTGLNIYIYPVDPQSHSNLLLTEPKRENTQHTLISKIMISRLGSQGRGKIQTGR